MLAIILFTFKPFLGKVSLLADFGFPDILPDPDIRDVRGWSMDAE